MSNSRAKTGAMCIQAVVRAVRGVYGVDLDSGLRGGTDKGGGVDG